MNSLLTEYGIAVGGAKRWIICPEEEIDRHCRFWVDLFPVVAITIFNPICGLVLWLEAQAR